MALIHIHPLRAARLNARISQDELALRSGLSQTAISAIERGVATPSVDQLGALAKALSADVCRLIPELEEST